MTYNNTGVALLVGRAPFYSFDVDNGMYRMLWSMNYFHLPLSFSLGETPINGTRVQN